MPSYTVHCPACHAANRIPAEREGQAGRCGACHAPLPPRYHTPQPLDDRTFDRFLHGYGGPVLAEFWAPW